MDDHRFDHWARTVFATGSRRAVTKALAAGTLGAVLAQLGGEDAAAKCINPGRKCDRQDNKRDKCCGGAKCRGPRGSQECRCPGGRPACGKLCCAKGDICAGGKCVTGRADCPAGADACATGASPCGDNPNCECYERLEGGVRCVQFQTDLGACDQCADDADCKALGFPPGSSCIRDDGPNCFCEPGNLGYCGEPCGFVPPVDDAAPNRTPARRGPGR